MEKPLPKWIMQRYCTLYTVYGIQSFSHEQASTTLANDSMLGITLSVLRKYGWMQTALDQQDSRKRIYTLIDPIQVIGGIGKSFSQEIANNSQKSQPAKSKKGKNRDK